MAAINEPKPVDPQLLQSGEAAPQEVIQQQVVSQDYSVLRLAVVGLILAILLSLAGVVYLTFAERNLPEGLTAIGSAAVGALATMLVSPSRRQP